MDSLTLDQHERVKQFRLKLAADPDVESSLIKGGEEPLNQRTLQRWLVARKWDLAKAATDLTLHAKWRAEVVPKGRVLESTMPEELAMNKSFLPGLDLNGRPTMVARVKNHLAEKKPGQFKLFLMHGLDTGIGLGMQEEARTGVPWDGKIVGILDLQNVGLANMDVKALGMIFELLQAHYVERLHKLYLFEAPTIFYAIWKVVVPFIDPVTKSKVEFVFKKDAAKIFGSNWAPEVLPKEFGGTAPDIRTCDVAAKLLADKLNKAELLVCAPSTPLEGGDTPNLQADLPQAVAA